MKNDEGEVDVEIRINAELLRKELEFCEAHPDRHDQRNWARPANDTSVVRAHEADACGTAACLAGWTALHAGYDITVSCTGHAYATSEHASQVGGHVKTVAARLLGLTNAEANLLFASLNTLARLWWLAHYLTEGAVEVPPQHHDDTLAHQRAYLTRVVRDSRRQSSYLEWVTATRNDEVTR